MSESKVKEEKIQAFSKELEALQLKYMLRLVAMVEFPGGAILNVPLTATPIPEKPKEILE